MIFISTSILILSGVCIADDRVLYPDEEIDITQSGHTFGQFEVKIYEGKIKPPVVYYETNKKKEVDEIHTIVKKGDGYYRKNGVGVEQEALMQINFGGKYVLTSYGCGTACSYAVLIDVEKGKYVQLGGHDPGFEVEEKEESTNYDYTKDGMKFTTEEYFLPNSNLLVEQYLFSDNNLCRERSFILKNEKFVPLGDYSNKCSKVIRVK